MPSKPLKRLFANFLICTLLCARLLYQAGPQSIHSQKTSKHICALFALVSFFLNPVTQLTHNMASVHLTTPYQHGHNKVVQFKRGIFILLSLTHKRQTGEKGCLVLNDTCIDDLSKFWFCINIPQTAEIFKKIIQKSDIGNGDESQW